MKRWNKVLFTIHYSPFTRKAFTLAEVLITLGIIGVVASITIPTLMQNTQNAELVTKMKKEYSVLSNAFEQLKTDSGGDFTYALANGTGTSNPLLKNVFKSKLSYIRECSSSVSGGCLTSNIKLLKGITDNTGLWAANAYGSPGLVLKDGAALTFILDDLTCQLTRGNYSNECGWILMDVNGMQPPNTWGRDVYLFFVFSDVVRPESSVINGSDDCDSTHNGFTCASKYLLGN